MQLENKVAIITGASSGIGEATALKFAREGARLVLAARRQDLLQSLAARIVEAGGQAVVLAGNVKDEAYASALVDLSVQTYGRLDIAINNAGTLGDIGPVPEMSAANWQDVMAINLESAFYGAKYQIPAMVAAGGGSLVFTSSFVGHTIGLPGMAAYAASKAGLIGLAQCLAVEHGAEGVRANALLPGGTKTPMAGDDPDYHAFVANMAALKRMAQAEEIADAAAFLASDQSSFVTGTALIVDGGNSITKT
jgi:NAD(P)-dependent dehydrogenase (short-subunit alcohol dehydrogenase family)